MKTYRNSRGRFASWKKHLYGYTIVIILVAAFSTIANKTTAVQEPKIDIASLVEKLSGEKLAAKIAELKHDLVRRLSEDCEAKGSVEPESLITFDTGGQASVGYLQFYRPTIQFYIKQRDDREITKKEATEIAMDWEKASSLAEYIIFEVGAGPDEWTTCFKKLGLKSETDIINRLAK